MFDSLTKRHNEIIGAELDITSQRAGRWRSCFVELGMNGILKEEQRSDRHQVTTVTAFQKVPRTELPTHSVSDKPTIQVPKFTIGKH
jgi:hypothetical protein